MIRIALITALLLSAAPALADDAGVIANWYAALGKPDREKLSALLDGKAIIQLQDLGLEQTKDEFIASMDEWETAVAGAVIRHRIEKNETGSAEVLTCYDFPDNDILMRERFRIEGEVITGSTQETVADNCDAF
ncbi:MAG: nuclear transport factor 2 family protein [Rhizobiaceae bacterium]